MALRKKIKSRLKMNVWYVFFIIFLLTSCARVPWTKTDKAMFAVACAAQGYDFYTTGQALHDGHKMRSEWQWLYGGDDPSTGALAASKAAQMGLVWVVLDRTPSDLRRLVLFIMTGGWIYYGGKNK